MMSTNHTKHKIHKLWMLVVGLLILTACTTPSQTSEPTSAPTANTSAALPVEKGEYFAGSGLCATCHKDMVDGDGHDVSLDTYWQATMMANSSRDPYWQASVRGEVISNPDYDEIIQDKCTTCHTPMARTTRIFEGDKGVLLDNGFLDPNNDLNTLALDGISCTLCHQIEPDNLGTAESYDGHYIISEEAPTGERLSYGPYQTDAANVTVMQAVSGYIPSQSSHIQTSELCGSCHTLYTPTVDNNGEVAGMFPEQMPYIEWLASDYADQNSCPDCHMPQAPGEVTLSVTGGPGRSPFSIHSFAGGNTYALLLLDTFPEELKVSATTDQLQAALLRAVTQLQEKTASIKVTKTEQLDNFLNVYVTIQSQVGHKFPSGFPSRRVWVHLVVTDIAGNPVFESGAWDALGAITGNLNDQDDTAYEPHYEVITKPDQVQIYEVIMGDVDAAVTTTLLRGAVYLKDNRLLPTGFVKTSVSPDIAVYGTALQDPNFIGGSDQLLYQVEVGAAQGPFTVQVELLYQSLGYRWAQNLSRFEAPEPQRFIRYFNEVPNEPTLVTRDTTVTSEEVSSLP